MKFFFLEEHRPHLCHENDYGSVIFSFFERIAEEVPCVHGVLASAIIFAAKNLAALILLLYLFFLSSDDMK